MNVAVLWEVFSLTCGDNDDDAAYLVTGSAPLMGGALGR